MASFRRLLLGLMLMLFGALAAPAPSIEPHSPIDIVVDTLAPQAQAITSSQRALLRRGVSPVASWDASTGTLTSLAALVTATRTSNATMFDSTGKLTYAPNNLLTYSNTFSNAAWTKATMTVAGGFTDPLGGSNATRLTATGATSYVVQSTPSATGLNVVTSIWVRRVSGSGTINLWTIGGSTGTAIVPTSTWTQYSATGNAPSGVAYAGVIVQTSGDVIDVYAATASAVTYETTPRTADQVITTSAAYYGPRIDYDPSTLAVKGLLIEENRTNLVIQSGFASAWSAIGVTAGADATTDLTGATAKKISVNAGASTHNYFLTGPLAVSASTAYAESWFVKAGTHSKILINVGDGTRYSAAVFDVSGTADGVATQVASAGDTSVSGISKYYGNGWFRLTLLFTTATGSVSRYFEVAAVNALTGNTFSGYGENSWTAAGTETFYVGQPQLEPGSFATSYIPTAATSVTRAADALAAAAYSSNPAIIQYRDQATGTRARKVINPWSGISSETAERMEIAKIYPVGTPTTYLNAHLTVDGAW